MVRSMYAAISGLRTHQSKMDVISNNIANVNTWGFKSRSANFEDAMYFNLVNSTGGNETPGGLGGTNPSQIGYGVNLGSISTNFGSGSWGYTGRPLDCMITGTGFFVVGGMAADPATGVPFNDLPSGNLKLSRVGIFSVDDNGYLVDNGSNYVYGFEQAVDNTTGTPVPEFDADGNPVMNTTTVKPLQIPIMPGSTPPERYDIQNYKISTDGMLSGIDKDNNVILIGQMAIASVENVDGLVQSSGYTYEIGDNAGQVQAIQTIATTTGQILNNNLEMSNVDLATDMASMITTQRGYQANSKIITVTDEMLEQLVNMKR